MKEKSNGIKAASSVQPIKKKNDVKKVRGYLKGKNLRDFVLFVCGVNFLLRASDLRLIKWEDVLDHEGYKESFEVKEKKTSKPRVVHINVHAKEALELYRDEKRIHETEGYIFKSRKGEEPIGVKAIHYIVSQACDRVGLKGNFGSHTLRKTGAYRIYAGNIETNPAIISYLQKILNHKSQSDTLRYIGIEQEEIEDIFDNIKW